MHVGFHSPLEIQSPLPETVYEKGFGHWQAFIVSNFLLPFRTEPTRGIKNGKVSGGLSLKVESPANRAKWRTKRLKGKI